MHQWVCVCVCVCVCVFPRSESSSIYLWRTLPLQTDLVNSCVMRLKAIFTLSSPVYLYSLTWLPARPVPQSQRTEHVRSVSWSLRLLFSQNIIKNVTGLILRLSTFLKFHVAAYLFKVQIEYSETIQMRQCCSISRKMSYFSCYHHFSHFFFKYCTFFLDILPLFLKRYCCFSINIK